MWHVSDQVAQLHRMRQQHLPTLQLRLPSLPTALRPMHNHLPIRLLPRPQPLRTVQNMSRLLRLMCHQRLVRHLQSIVRSLERVMLAEMPTREVLQQGQQLMQELF